MMKYRVLSFFRLLLSFVSLIAVLVGIIAFLQMKGNKTPARDKITVTEEKAVITITGTPNVRSAPGVPDTGSKSNKLGTLSECPKFEVSCLYKANDPNNGMYYGFLSEEIPAEYLPKKAKTVDVVWINYKYVDVATVATTETTHNAPAVTTAKTPAQKKALRQGLFCSYFIPKSLPLHSSWRPRLPLLLRLYLLADQKRLG